jgi:phosphoenolpyruvate carboxykinase (ATP)
LQETAQLSRDGFDSRVFSHGKRVYWNLSPEALYEEAIKRGEGILAHGGPLVVHTGKYTGRSPHDKYIVRESSSEDQVWWGSVNRPIEESRFNELYSRFLKFLEPRELFARDCYAGADPQDRLNVRIITETAWQNLFAHNMFIRPPVDDLGDFRPDFTLIAAPNFEAVPQSDGTRSEVFIILHFGLRRCIIGSSRYGGEIKKAIFTLLNYLSPLKDVFSMHCSANVGASGDVALFFGLSGTGKTTLSADPQRRLIGDDEHGWGSNGVYNFEGGCYAKVINLSEMDEPEIYHTTRTFGTIIENVVLDPVTRIVDLDEDLITENTRACYPLSQIPNHVYSGMGKHPANIIFLTADAFGVMPPIAKLTPQQAMYHFLSGYTAKVAGTEKGVEEPAATFSTCFGAPFMVHHPTVYAHMLGERITRHKVNCWMVNTGWTGGAYGTGSRMKISHTRAMVSAALEGKLDGVGFSKDAVFGTLVPQSCPDVPSDVLQPRNTWADKEAYDAQSRRLAGMFVKNFEQFASEVSEQVRSAGPKILS